MTSAVQPGVYLMADLCARLKVSRRVVERLRACGAFPIPEVASLDDRPRWSIAAVDAFLESGQTVQARRRKHVPTVARGEFLHKVTSRHLRVSR